MVTRYDDIEQGEVLWIRPETYYLPEQPGGFALRVDEFLGWDYGDQSPRRVWVRGPVLLDAPGASPRTVTVCVPVDQPRAVPAAPARVGGSEAGTHTVRGGGAGTIQHAGRRYRRVV